LRTVAALAATVAVGLAGCGAADDSTTTQAAPTATGQTEIVVTLDPDGKGGKPPLAEIVACPGRDADACDAIDALPADPAAPVPSATACTEIYGGPDTLAIQGTLHGEPIDARFTRSDGCEIDRFDRFVPLLKALFPDYEPGAALGA
jgi:hypothetical protein